MNRTRQRMAWVVLLFSFLICAILTTSIALGVPALIERARDPLALTAQSSQGTLVRDSGIPLSASDAPATIDAPIRLRTNNLADIGFVTLSDPESEQLLGRLTVYGNTDVTIDNATTPRFESSESDSLVQLYLERGRILMTLNESIRPTIVYAQSEHGLIAIDQPGNYSIEVNQTTTQLSVRDGSALLQAGENELRLQREERGIIETGGIPQGPLGTERDLVRNGDFGAGLNSWITTTWLVEPGREGEPPGQTEVVNVDGETSLQFRREGVGNAKNEVRQLIAQDVIDFQELKLSISLRINQQSLEVCGGVGSECPLTVRVDYEDEFGRTVAWQQGFYAIGTPVADGNPPFCSGCGDPLRLNAHAKVNAVGELVVYESENWMERLAQEGFRPIRIDTISLIAEGHSFDVEVVDVALIAKE